MQIIEASAEVLIAQGYRRISDSKGIVARIDRFDWRDQFSRKQNPFNFDKGEAFVNSLTDLERSHLYLKIWSEDNAIVFDQEEFMKVPRSDELAVEFVPRAR